ncbi:MAG: hypothetical protein AB1716_01110 [Planctomycetota bacterium]
MKLPRLDEPARYRGLYIFELGEWTAVGYTAEEIAALLESEEYRGGRVYRIVRVTPSGEFELRGVAPERFQLESGMFFTRQDRDAARADFEELRRLGAPGAPCRAYIQLAEWHAGGHRPREAPLGTSAEDGPRYVTALIYPAEHEDEIARWLADAGYAGGDLAEGGISLVTDYYERPKTILDRQQLWSRPAIPSRSRDEVLRSARVAVQR